MNKLIGFIMVFSSQVYAGVWGTGSFENDSAADWAYELDLTKPASYLLAVFNAIPPNGYIDADACSVAIAAADVTASLKDGKTENLPPSVATWVVISKREYKPFFATKALEAIGYCKNTERSEIAQLWSEGDPQQWLDQVLKIETRLK